MFNKLRISTLLSILFISLALSFIVSCDSPSATTLSIQSTQPGQANLSNSSQRAVMSRNLSTPISIPVIAKNGNPAGTLELEKAFIAVKEIEIELEGHDDEESEYTGTFLVDLLTNTVTPEFPIINLPDGKYDEIEMDIDKLDGTELDAAGNFLVVEGDVMFGRSLYLEGTYHINSTTTLPFKLAYTTEEEIKLKDENSINTFALTGYTNLVIAFRMDSWFDFSNIETNPLLEVDFSSILTDLNLADPSGLNDIKVKVMEVIQENLEASADFGIDDDDDGILGEDEDDD